MVCPNMFGCLLYIHNTRKAYFVRQRGCPYAPYIRMPPYVWMTPCMFGCPICLPVCLDTLICLDAPICLMKFGFPLVHTQHKESMLCQTKGCPLYVWMPQNVQGIQRYEGHPNIWVVSKYMGVPKHTGGIQTYGASKWMPLKMYGASKGMRDIQIYRYCQNIWGCPNIQETSKNMGHQNIWGASNHMGASKCMESLWTPLSLTKHAFFVLCVYSRHPNIFQTYMEASKHRGAQTYREYPNI